MKKREEPQREIERVPTPDLIRSIRRDLEKERQRREQEEAQRDKHKKKSR